MRIHKLYIAVGLVLAFGLFFELAAHASEINEQVKMTFSEPFQVPGHALPAGTYIFQRAEDDNPDFIRIFNGDGTVLEATLQTVPTEQAEPVGDTVVRLARAEPGNPDYLVKYYYPGRTIGHEFVYPKQQEQQIASAPQQTIVANGSMSSADIAGD